MPHSGDFFDFMSLHGGGGAGIETVEIDSGGDQMSIFVLDSITQTAGTVITDIVPGFIEDDLTVTLEEARVTVLTYLSLGTAHTLTLMRPIASTATVSQANSGQKVINVLTASPGKNSAGVYELLATNDYIAWIDVDGVFKFDFLASVAGSALTTTTNLPSNIPSGSTIWTFYEVGRASNRVFTPQLGVTRTYYPLFQAGISKQVDKWNIRSGAGDPLLFHSTNASNAGILEQLSGIYVTGQKSMT